MQNTETRAADSILEKGVKVQVKAPFILRICRKKTIPLIIYQPTMGNKLRINRLYLKMGITPETLDGCTQEVADALMVKHSQTLLRIIAIALCNGFIMPWLLNRPLAFWLKWKLDPKDVCVMAQVLVAFSGTEHFTNTIRLIQGLMITSPNLSQQAQGS